MATYGTTLTVYYETLPNLGIPTHTHNIEHGACTSSEVNANISRWVIPADPDDSIGSRGEIVLAMQIENVTYTFHFAFACNNKLQNFVNVSYSEAHFTVHIVPSAQVIKTMAPLDAVITITKK